MTTMIRHLYGLSRSYAFIALLIPSTLAQQLNLYLPDTLRQCSSTNVYWSGGSLPYSPSIGSPLGASIVGALFYFPNLSGRSFTWNTNLTQGTVIAFALSDSTGNEVVSAAYTILWGYHDNCLSDGVGVGSPSQHPSISITSSSRPIGPTVGGQLSYGTSYGSTMPDQSASMTTSDYETATPSTDGLKLVDNQLSSGGVARVVAAGIVVFGAVIAWVLWRKRSRTRSRRDTLSLAQNRTSVVPPSPSPGRPPPMRQHPPVIRKPSVSSFDSDMRSVAPPPMSEAGTCMDETTTQGHLDGSITHPASHFDLTSCDGDDEAATDVPTCSAPRRVKGQCKGSVAGGRTTRFKQEIAMWLAHGLQRERAGGERSSPVMPSYVR